MRVWSRLGWYCCYRFQTNWKGHTHENPFTRRAFRPLPLRHAHQQGGQPLTDVRPVPVGALIPKDISRERRTRC
jgi:hypothetical protein